MTLWVESHRADASVVPIADRHYNRQKIGAPQFAPPGRCLVLKTPACDAFWITSYPYAEYVKHAWAGAWVCSAFRNESAHLSSELIRHAVAITRAKWAVPDLGMVTFVDPTKVRRKRDFGRCYLRAGFRPVGSTKGGLLAFQMLPEDMPPAADFIFAERKHKKRRKVLDSHTTVTDNFNPQQLKVKDMEDFEQQAIIRAVDALETIAEHMGVLASMALANAQPAPAGEQPKRPRGRPRKDATVHMVGTPAPEAPAAAPAPAAQAKPEPTEAERAEKFGKLKTALKECLALHGEEAARARLQFPKFSEVPYEAIEATIERLAA
jgi:hypothetical protein